MKKLFGTDGIRGEAGKFPLDEKTVSTIGSSLSGHIKSKNGAAPRFLVGRDTRESGEWIERAFLVGAGAAGAVCESAGVITTPGIAYLTGAEDFDAGIVISASHNPFQDNGLKIFLPSGKKIGEETERAIEKDIFEEAGLAENKGSAKSESSASHQANYLDHLFENFSSLDLSGLRLAVDCANGAASFLAPKLFERFGAEVFAFNFQPDGRNINFNCGSLHLDHLQEKVVSERADFGVAFDGDADRSLFVDEKGGVADGDTTLWIMAKHLKSLGKLNGDLVVATVMSNIGLELALESIGVEMLRTSVGDKYVLEELLKTRASIGGEQSGHIIFPGESLVGDGMQTALHLLEAIQTIGKPFSELREGFTQYPQILVNVKVAEKRPFDEIEAIANEASVVENELGETGRLLLRYSGTENLARVMIEGQDQQEIEAQAKRLAATIQTTLG